MNGAFGNYRDLMRAVTLNPAMGRYLNMLNNRKQTFDAAVPTSPPPNENYPRELLQLFTLGHGEAESRRHADPDRRRARARPTRKRT